MRIVGLILIFTFIGTANADSLSFETKGYKYKAELSGDYANIDWRKGGFNKSLSKKMKSCWKKNITKELFKIRKELFSKRGRNVHGNEVLITWNKEKESRQLFPLQIDKLDKKLTHLFNMVKLSEKKCKK